MQVTGYKELCLKIEVNFNFNSFRSQDNLFHKTISRVSSASYIKNVLFEIDSICLFFTQLPFISHLQISIKRKKKIK